MKDDVISRQGAIDAFKKELTVGESKGNYVTICSAVGYEGAKQILESLPSAQPEILACGEGELISNQDVPDTNVGDLISRQALLRQIDIDSDGEPGYYGDTWKFIDTIKVMPSAQPNVQDSVKDADCISRQAVLNMLHRECSTMVEDFLRNKINAIPSAQPETNCSEFPNNSDTISRQAAIDAVEALAYHADKYVIDSDVHEVHGFRTGLAVAERQLSLVPSAQPEIIRCGECKYYTPVTAHCEIRGKGLYLIRGMEDFCSRAERRTDET